ncbi:MAG TPA: T9SS type A sorting domain-containing protein [Edaphocola sp.]|nr:T9SS type A sorting domain-containing protein [Edaphocola sp.]
MYPNPAGSELWLKSNGNVQLKTVLVYNLLGQELRREKVSSKGLYRMDVRSLAPGFYLLKALLSDGSVAQGKFEVRR